MKRIWLCAALVAAAGCDDDDGLDAFEDAGFFEDGGLFEDAAADAAADAGPDAGLDAGADAAVDAGPDADVDAGSDGAADAGADGPTDAGVDAATDAGACVPPDSGLYATFDVSGEVFRAQITDDDAIESAIALWRGESSASIPNGVLVCEPTEANCGYSWHMQPDTIEFADVTIEVCDGAPSYIEDNCESFVDRYCPWGAMLIELRDCREAGCPEVSR